MKFGKNIERHKGSKVVKMAGVGVFILLSASIIWRWISPNSIAEVAVSVRSAMVDGDGNRLFQSASPQEIGCSNLTPDKVGAAWRLLIKPAIQTSKFIRYAPAALNENGVQASASAKFLDHKGNPWEIYIIANQTDTVPKASIVYEMMCVAASFDKKLVVRPFTAATMIDGIHRFAPALRAAGIEKISINPKNCLSFSELQKMLTPGAKLEKG
jgi:hypothetical protein